MHSQSQHRTRTLAVKVVSLVISAAALVFALKGIGYPQSGDSGAGTEQTPQANPAGEPASNASPAAMPQPASSPTPAKHKHKHHKHRHNLPPIPAVPPPGMP